MGTVKSEKITIKTLVGTTLTADLTNSYTANSALSDFVGYVVNSSHGFGAVASLISESGATATGNASYNSITETSFDPGVYEDRWILLDLFFSVAAGGLFGKSRHVRRCPVINAPLAVEDVLQENDGTEWRVFQAYSSWPIAVKEV